uniref:UDP-xylose and UDP-N-acetylglucosamine transporter n=1 Tax=Panagrolaimus sp. JU765 TaxID=591449 RepID=A0AC34Q8N9_9BILA
MASLCVAGVLGGCSSSMILIESLSKSSANPMHLVTLATFILVPLYCLYLDPSIIRKSSIPSKEYGVIILLFFVTNILNNQTINYDIPFPLFIIFRSGTILASVLLTAILQRRIYSWTKILAVFSVTFGIVLFTLASSHQQSQLKVDYLWIDHLPWPRFVTGIIAQIICVFLAAYLGIRQETLFGRYGKCPDEMMFYVHIYSLPLFMPVLPDIFSIIQSFNNYEDSFSDFLPVSSLWLQLLLVCICQIICIRSIYRLTSVVSSLSVNMILALRKFLNLLFSAWIFNNELNLSHWLAAAMIIGGTCAFYNTFGQIKEHLTSKNAKKTD